MKIHTAAIVVALGLALLTACTNTSSAEVGKSSLNLISSEKLRSHVTYLSDDALAGRRPGEPGFQDAAAYVAGQFDLMGLEKAGAKTDWYQAVNLRRYQLLTDRAKFRMHRNDGDIELTYRDDFAMGADEVRPETSVTADVAYVGHGVHAPEFGYSDYADIDVRGKIVAFFGGAPETIGGDARSYYGSIRTKATEAVKRGAVGLIRLRSKKTEARRSWESVKKRFGSRPSTTWVSDDGRAADYYPEIISSGWLSIASAKQLFDGAALSFEEAHSASVKSVPSSADLSVAVTMATATEHSTIKSPNVIGMVRGTDPKLASEYVVYTAHLDHIGLNPNEGALGDRIRNGMYDNAMGVALMLETARAIAASPPRRSVLFIALTAEESGLLGSDYFVNNPVVPMESIVANINLDMPLFLFPLADLVAFGSQHSSLHSVALSAAKAEGFTLSKNPMPDENLFVRSDQYSFVRHGIPAVFLVSGFNSTEDGVDGEALSLDHIKNHYHKPSDDLSRPVHWPSAVRFARAHTRLGLSVANNASRPSWNDGDFFGSRFGKGQYD